MHLYRVVRLAVLGLLIANAFPLFIERANAQQPQPQRPQQVVETVDIQGNRRLRKEDVLYYIQTRPGDDKRRCSAWWHRRRVLG